MKLIFYFLALSVFLLSCKKDRLIDEKSFLIGKWNWIYTLNIIKPNGNPSYQEIKTPTSTNATYSVEFKKEGWIKFYKNGEYYKRNRLVFDSFNYSGTNSVNFSIFLDGKEDKTFSGGGSTDTLTMTYPYVYGNTGHTQYYTANYFVKE